MLYRVVIVVLIMAGLILPEFEIVMGAEFKLGSRFQDADGDMVADTPNEPGKQVDPSTLIFAYTPVEDPAVYAKVWKGFLEHMEKVTGKKVQFFPVQSNAAQIEAMRAGRLHVAGFNTGSNPIAVACAGFKPFATMASAAQNDTCACLAFATPSRGEPAPESIRDEGGVGTIGTFGTIGTGKVSNAKPRLNFAPAFQRLSQGHHIDVLQIPAHR